MESKAINQKVDDPGLSRSSHVHHLFQKGLALNPLDVGGIGIVLAEKLIARHLHLTWEHHLITADSLWLVGVADIPC